MQEDERIVLTRDKIEEKLKKENKNSLVFLIGTIAFFVIVGWLLSYAFGDIPWLKIAIYAIVSFFSINCLCIFIRYAIIFKKGEFGIIEDTVTNIERDKIDKGAAFTSNRNDPLLKERITFKRMGAHMLNKHTLGHLSIDDRVLLVVIKPFKKHKIIEMYNLREYRFEK